MVIHAPRMACRPDIGVESGCQLVPEPSRLMAYGPSSPIMPAAPGCDCCAPAAGASAASTQANAEGAHTDIRADATGKADAGRGCSNARSEEHTSELQSHLNLVCRLLLE